MRNLLRFIGGWVYAVLITFGWTPGKRDDREEEDQSR